MMSTTNRDSPVRRVKPNRRSNTGYYNSLKAGNIEFESQLERDTYILLDFEPTVRAFSVQPLRIANYVPDCLIETTEKLKILVDVKYEAELVRDWDALRFKFEKARKYADENEFVFGFITDSIVYNVENRVDILKFIKYTAGGKYNNEIRSRLFTQVSHCDRITIKSLLEELKEFDNSSAIREACRLICSGVATVLETPTANLLDVVLISSSRSVNKSQSYANEFFIAFEKFLKRLKTNPNSYLRGGGTARFVS